jgi:hypothetical protein
MDKPKHEDRIMQLDQAPSDSVCKVARVQMLNAQAGFEPITGTTPEAGLGVFLIYSKSPVFRPVVLKQKVFG